MSGLFGHAPSSTPAPVPVAPIAPADSDNPAEAQKLAEQRAAAERAAIAERKAAGRASTIVGGRLIAEDEQYGRGLLSKRRDAARDLVG